LHHLPQVGPSSLQGGQNLGGRYHVLARTEEGDVYTWGNNFYRQCQPKDVATVVPEKNPEVSKFSEFFVGGDYTLAVDPEGILWGWGTLEQTDGSQIKKYLCQVTPKTSRGARGACRCRI
jgi:alpha-tubulin suppressor-like RCC1 family protein